MNNEVRPCDYGGFRPWADTVAATLKPGETLDVRANKFANIGHGAVYGVAPPREHARDTTNQQLSFQKNVSPHHYQVPDKRGVSAAWTASAEEACNASGRGRGKTGKAFLGRSTYEAEHQDPTAHLAEEPTRPEPEWLAASRMRHPDPLPRHPTQLTSAHREDFGTHVHDHAPRNKALMYKGGMAGTANDLNEGTSKHSFHLPGYGGYIPANQRNPVVHLHGTAEAERAKPGTLRMSHRHNMVGYTGYVPKNAHNDHGPMSCGANPASTAGAASLNMML